MKTIDNSSYKACLVKTGGGRDKCNSSCKAYLVKTGGWRDKCNSSYKACLVKTGLILLLSMLFFFGCNKKETVLRVALPEMPENLHPINRNFYARAINRNVYETVSSRDYDRRIAVLADYWYSLDDTLSVIKIREDIRFNDGTFLTSHDVKRSIEAYLDLLSDFRRAVRHIDARDDFYVYIYYYRGVLQLFQLLDFIYIFKTDEVSSNEVENVFLQKTYSTGEYAMREVFADKLILEKNIYHRDFKKNKNSPDIIEIYIEPDYDKQYLMFLDGEIDFLTNLPISAYYDIQRYDNFSVIETNSDNLMFMYFDTTLENHPEINLPVNPLRDKRVRQAIAHAIDTRTLVRTLLNGKANLLAIPALQRLQGYPTHLEHYTYDLEYSRALMAEAGLSDGFTMRMRVLEGKLLIAMAAFIQESLKDINIDIELDIYPTNEFRRTFTEQPAASFLMGISQNQHNNISRAMALFQVNNYNNIGLTGALIRRDPRINSIYQQIGNNVNEFDERLPELYRQLAETVYEEVYILPFFEPLDIYLVNERFNFTYRQNYKFVDFKVKR